MDTPDVAAALRARISEAKANGEALLADPDVHCVIETFARDGEPVQDPAPTVIRKADLLTMEVELKRLEPAFAIPVVVPAARRTPRRSSAPATRTRSRGHVRRDDPGRESGSGGDDDPPHSLGRRFEVDLARSVSRPLNGHAPWPGSHVMVELVLDDRLELERRLLRSAAAAARVEREAAWRREMEELAEQERRSRCSRCRRRFDDPATRGQLPGRAWCRRCEVARVTKAAAA
jgi:hypothetical protein